ncbi:low-density lipo protein receptor [Lindgomyces ingoldianus]|uniref:Low-density lipo protein receptor n=1 Tax=Lindgomyces ingoldianus TaxID=673940 RepID=A0ACB6QPY8_9PLEO|nr:low-density lipo protein receptor [Lindgomyces ingoldianus]KAF2469063.1 low-density lipo protein receptor [Lindgomyces ingoldianus]
MSNKQTTRVLVFLDVGASAHKNGIPQGRILKCDLNGANLKVICEGLYALPDGIAVDNDEGYIYFTQMGMPGTKTGSVSRVRLDGTGREDIIETGKTWTPKQLLLEPQSKKLYWADREGARIWRANRDGSDAEVLIQTVPSPLEVSVSDQTKWCVGVAVDYERRKIFWTQKGPSKGFQGQLWTANLDISEGETPENRSDKKLLLSKLPEPIDLAIDTQRNILFLSDRGDIPLGNTISAIDVNDLEAIKLNFLVWKLHEAIGVTYDPEGQRIYMTDLLGGLYSANADGSDKKTLHPDLGELTGLTIAQYWD